MGRGAGGVGERGILVTFLLSVVKLINLWESLFLSSVPKE